jgi:hypothetical protein
MVTESYFCGITVVYETQHDVLENTACICRTGGGSMFLQSIYQAAHSHDPQDHSINLY